MQTYSEFSDNIVTLKPNINHLYQPAISSLSDKTTDPTHNNTTPFYQTLRGTIVPPEWKSIHTKDGKKLSRGSLELYAIIVSWHNYKKVKDKEAGRITFTPKFEGDELRKNYDYFTKELDRSQEQVRRYFAELKAANLVWMDLRTIRHKNWKYHNTLCIKLNKEAPHFIKGQGADYKTTNEKPFATNDTDTSDIINNSINAELDIKDFVQSSDNIIDIKKIWAAPLKKVGCTPQKSGVYIENNYSKTIVIRSVLDKSNFLNKNFVFSINFKPHSVTEASFYKTSLSQPHSLQPSKNTARFLKTNSQYIPSTILPISQVGKVERSLEDIIKNLDRPTQVNNPTQKTNSSVFSNFVQPRSLPRMPLSSFYPLCEEDAVFLRKASGRPFSLSFINKLLLKLSADYPDRGFYKKSLLLSYLTSSLIKEKRDACKVSCESFNFKPKPGSIEYDSKIQNDYLNAIELSPATNISTRIKRRIIGLFNNNDAYNIITSCRLPYIADNHNITSYKIEAPNSLTETQRSVLTQAIQDVLGKTIEVIFREKENRKAGRGNFMKGSTNFSLNSETIISSSPLWQKIRENLTKRYGDAIDKSWFSKCDIENNPDSKQILIKAPTNFTKDWIKQNYSSAIEEIISGLSKTAQALLPNIDMTDKSYKWLEWGVH